jgi:hypothetical protein
LIAEIKRVFHCGMQVRPGAIDFIIWLYNKATKLHYGLKLQDFGHALLSRRYAPLYLVHTNVLAMHAKTFDFVWCTEKL